MKLDQLHSGHRSPNSHSMCLGDHARCISRQQAPEFSQQSTLSGLKFVFLACLQTLKELHAEAAGRNEALVALEGLTKESAARQERLREAMQACQHLQSELEAAQVPLHSLSGRLTSMPLVVCTLSCCSQGLQCAYRR